MKTKIICNFWLRTFRRISLKVMKNCAFMSYKILKMGCDLTRAFSWLAVNKGLTRLWSRYFMTWSKEIFYHWQDKNWIMISLLRKIFITTLCFWFLWMDIIKKIHNQSIKVHEVLNSLSDLNKNFTKSIEKMMIILFLLQCFKTFSMNLFFILKINFSLLIFLC